ncbi:hypothetical protein NDU88_003453 [Pleurodeles waltl]|uniref:Uncharacterized protein n=1 Tax=Pleurodeles waltl TaxID=8319 RepID=A0AAV7TPN2_PLEWA|nr:hypothetical protein NDU88_003453 [Pleurodeles waltl]
MVKFKGNAAPKLIKWITTQSLGVRQKKRRWGAESAPAGEPSLGAIMAATQDLKGTLEPKLDTVTIDVALLRAYIQKVREKVTTAESHIMHLQSTTERLEYQVQSLMKQATAMAGRNKD